MAVIDRFTKSSEGQAIGHLQAIRSIVLQEMVFRASKHILRQLLHGLSAANSVNALSHFMNCLVGSARNAQPVAEVDVFDFAEASKPDYASLTPESLRKAVIDEVAKRFRWTIDDSYILNDLRKQQFVRELATRIAFQLAKKQYNYSAVTEDSVTEDEKTGGVKSRKAKKGKTTEVVSISKNTFEPLDIITLLPVVKSCAPTVSICFD